jgi:pyruvate formate lyase activating enzyme
MQLQPFSVNDGDGIRTTIFMAGCPLRCKWCSNPEGFTAQEKVGWYQRKCIGCGACVNVCPQGIGINMNEDRSRCIVCGACVKVCPVDARTMMVTLTDAGEILKQIQKHRLFYSYSGGGVTFSGGEATSQLDFLDYLSREIYDMGYSMDIETCGLFDWDKTAPILARMDLIFMDLKMMDPAKHLEYTGVSNDRILRNIANLAKLQDVRCESSQSTHSEVRCESSQSAHSETGHTSSQSTHSDHGALQACADSEKRIGNDGKGPEIVIRIPVVGGVNDDEDNIRSSAAYVHRHLPHARMELLPYHRYGIIKYEALGSPYEHPDFRTPGKAEMERLRDIVRSEGVEVADFR